MTNTGYKPGRKYFRLNIMLHIFFLAFALLMATADAKPIVFLIIIVGLIVINIFDDHFHRFIMGPLIFKDAYADGQLEVLKKVKGIIGKVKKNKQRGKYK